MENEQEIDIVFLDGETRRVSGMTFSICCAKAAYQRVIEGACTHKELAVNEKACRLVKAAGIQPNALLEAHAENETTGSEEDERNQ
jgi:hypothetical protein